MKTKVIAEKFELTYMKELKRVGWIRKETYEVFTFKTKKNAIEYLKDMKKFTKKNLKIEADFTNANNYNEYLENWGSVKFYYRIVKA